MELTNYRASFLTFMDLAMDVVGLNDPTSATLYALVTDEKKGQA